MREGIFVAHTSHTNGQVLDDRTCRLSMNVITVGQGVFKETDHRVNVVFGHFSNVFENESEGFETTVSDVELGCTVLVQDSRDTGEGSTRLRHNS